MDNDKLIELITKEVMKRIKLMVEVNNNNKKVLILEKSENLCPVVKKILAENEMSVDSIDSMGNLDNYEFILIQNLSNNELINIAQGYQNSEKEKAIIDILLKGKKVYGLEKGLEYKEYEDVAPKGLIEVFQGYKEKLSTFGVEFTSLRAIIGSKVTEKSANKSEEKTQVKSLEKVDVKTHQNVITKKLVSEIDMKNMQKDGAKEVRISKKSIITPLAKDFARINNITITIES